MKNTISVFLDMIYLAYYGNLQFCFSGDVITLFFFMAEQNSIFV